MAARRYARARANTCLERLPQVFLHVKQVQVGNTVYGQVPRDIWLSHDVNIYTTKATNPVVFLRCFIYLMPKTQVFGNIWIIDYIFHFSSGFGSQPISVNKNSQILAVFKILTWGENPLSPQLL